jgi:hypothetical protein
MKKSYSEKLKDPRWQRKRLEIFQRDNFKCCLCGREDKTLHVHHKKYNGKDPWDISSEFLMTLCENCHEKEHDQPDFVEKYDRMTPILKKLSILTDDELEIFVRKRLGQKYPEPEFLGDGDYKRIKHLRFDFHAETAKSKVNNYQILALFEDVFNAGDHDHSPCINAYKGALWICGIWGDNGIDYSGWGTVDILKDIIRRTIRGEFPLINGIMKKSVMM